MANGLQTYPETQEQMDNDLTIALKLIQMLDKCRPNVTVISQLVHQESCWRLEMLATAFPQIETVVPRF
jgi:hypothetical protein